jgi:hypothetical protein
VHDVTTCSKQNCYTTFSHATKINIESLFVCVQLTKVRLVGSVFFILLLLYFQQQFNKCSGTWLFINQNILNFVCAFFLRIEHVQCSAQLWSVCMHVNLVDGILTKIFAASAWMLRVREQRTFGGERKNEWAAVE